MFCVFLQSCDFNSSVPVPLGLVIGIPLQCIATLVHELGHGGTALLVGADFYTFSLSPDGSGSAFVSGDSGVGSVLIGAGGLVGPAIIRSAVETACQEPPVFLAPYLSSHCRTSNFARNGLGVRWHTN